jgi:DNA-binding transcriptional LysR family regulator
MNQVRYFLALCEEKHFTRAAARCGVAQPSLTTAIKKLEQEFGGPLFDRRRGEPTELGDLIKPFFQRVARSAAAAKWSARRFAGAAASARPEVNGAPNSIAHAAETGPDSDETSRHAIRPEPIRWAPERVLP